MVIQARVCGRRIFDITGSGYEPKGEVTFDGKNIDPLNHSSFFSAENRGIFVQMPDCLFQKRQVLENSRGPHRGGNVGAL